MRLPNGGVRTPGPFWMVRMRTRAADAAHWYRGFDVFLGGGATTQVVGIDRGTESR
ncbi:MAG: hypothetical protein QF681_06230 [Vicinamibacterales bacterium]|nr:hypothetical protein [Vicinamibacterales bacterium]